MNAIKEINSDAQCNMQNDDLSTIEWINETAPISIEDIEAKATEIETRDAHIFPRERAYPLLNEFAEAYCEKEIGEDSTKWDTYVTKYNLVRSNNPKPD